MEGILSRHEFADRTVPDCILQYLATKLTGEWQSLARYLNISSDHLHNIEANNSGRRQDTIYFMLRHWREMNSAGATYRVLAKALDKAGRRDLREYVESQVEQQEDKSSDVSSKGKALDHSSVKQPSTSASDRVVTTATIQYLATELAGEWQTLARYLNISEADLYNIKANNSGCIQDTKYFMLSHWSERNGVGATYRVLATALDKAGRRDLRKYVESQVEHQEEKRSDVSSKGKAPNHSSVKQPSTSASDRVVTTAAIQSLSEKNCDEWRNVGRTLGIEEPQLQAINTDNSKAQEKVLQMLVTWEQSKGNEATYRLLGEALQSAGRKDLQDYLYQQGVEQQEDKSSDGSSKGKLDYPWLKGTLTVLLSKNDCHQLAHHVALPKYQLDAIINSDSSAKDLLDILEERGVIHTSNVSRLLEAISVLKINEKALFMLERYQRSRGDETSYGRFLAALSSHLLLSLPRKLCDYFKFTNEKKEAVITSQTPGISFLLTLEDMGVINPFDVGKLVTPLKQYQLVQAVAKVQEYQTLVDERSELKKPIHTLEGKQTLFIECLRKKTKSWYETLTPLPWKKSCKWMTSELFIACGLVLTDSKSKMKTTDVDQECKLKYTDILTHRRLKSATRIIIEGDPGSGKTMLSSQLAYDWSIGKSSDARMVVFLPLKFVDGMTIIEAIKQFYIPKGKPLNEGDIKAILDQASDENKTCIVLDGLEEYNGRTKDGEPSEVERVMRKEKFPNCTVVLTSRSDFVHDLPQCPMLKLGRFGEEERDQYIANIIPDDREKQQKVKCSIETSALLYDLCSNPLLFVYIVHNIEHLGQIDKPKGQLDSVGPFIEVMVNTLLSLSRSEHSESSESEIMSKRLSEIAFNGLCKGYQQLMWQKSFLNENVSNVKDWIESGILVVEEGVMAREEEHRNKEEAVEEGMVTQDEIISIEDERREGESSSEAAMIRKGQDDILSIDEECPRDRESSTDNKLNEKEKPFTEMKTSTDPQNLSVQVKSLHKVIQERFADDERREGESSSEAAMIGEGQDDILSIDEEKPSDRGSSTDIKPKELEKPFTKRKTSTDLQNLSLQVKFLHKVIQEWFAAKHFLSMLQRSKGKNRHRLFLNKHLPLINPADLHYVLRFTSYLCPENCYLIMEHLHSCYKSSKGVVPEYILNCIFLCFIECNSLVRNKRMDNPVRQVCKNIVTIRGEDNRLLQQSKVSMLMYASNSKIRIGTLRLVDLVVEVTKATLTFNSNITLECFPTLKVIEVSRWDMKLKEEDFEELIIFITKCKLLNKAFLSFPSPPPLLTDKKLLSSMKKNLTIEWIIGDRTVHTLDKKSGEWPMQFRSTPHQITDFSQPGPSKSSAHSGKIKKAKERTSTSKSGQKQDTEEPGSITTKKKHVNTGSQKIVQTPQITKVRDPTSVKQSSTSARQETERVGKSTAGIADLVVTTATIQPPDVLTQLHESLQNVFAEMTRSDSENLANFFMFPLKHVKAIVNSPSHSKDLVVELENKGIIQSALTDELLENLGALNILTGRSEGSKSSIYRPSSTFLKHEEDWKPPDTMKIKSSISEKGGLLQIPNTGIKLVFPPNAVTEERNIQVKIIPPSLLNEPATSFSSNSSVVLELLPNGLQLKREVSLTLPHCLTFANEEKARAKVYVSHHEEGQRPRWEERPLSPYIFHRAKCTVRLLGFCWVKIKIDDKEVVAKNIVVYAAKKILQNMETARISYGYYEDIPDRDSKILNLNPDLKLVQSLLFTIFKEGKQPITISFNGTYPRNSWAIEEGNEKQEIPWGYIDLSKEFLVHFELQRRQSRDSFCKFTAQQGNSGPIKFSIEMEGYLSRGEIADSPVPDYILEYLAENLCSEWQSLARYLNISDADLDNLKEDNRRCHQDTKYFMLHKWRKRNGTGATCRVLATALDKAGRRDLQEYVESQDLGDQQIQIKNRNEDRERSSSKYDLKPKHLEDSKRKSVSQKRKRAKHKRLNAEEREKALLGTGQSINIMKSRERAPVGRGQNKIMLATETERASVSEGGEQSTSTMKSRERAFVGIGSGQSKIILTTETEKASVSQGGGQSTRIMESKRASAGRGREESKCSLTTERKSIRLKRVKHKHSEDTESKSVSPKRAKHMRFSDGEPPEEHQVADSRPSSSASDVENTHNRE